MLATPHHVNILVCFIYIHKKRYSREYHYRSKFEEILMLHMAQSQNSFGYQKQEASILLKSSFHRRFACFNRVDFLKVFQNDVKKGRMRTNTVANIMFTQFYRKIISLLKSILFFFWVSLYPLFLFLRIEQQFQHIPHFFTFLLPYLTDLFHLFLDFTFLPCFSNIAALIFFTILSWSSLVIFNKC